MLHSNEQRISNLEFLTSRANGNNRFVKEMVSIFIEESTHAIHQIEKGINENNFDTIRRGAHILKSITIYVGVDRFIGREVLEIEKLAIAETNMDQIRALFATVNGIWAKAIRELKY
jgi:HPt (histidine-containing phosphotransfer) domain-containing protein